MKAKFFALISLMTIAFTSQSMNYSGDYIDNLLGLGAVRLNGVYTNEDQELDGLAAALQQGKTADALKRVNNIKQIRDQRNKRMLQANITKGQRNLVGKIDELSEDAQADIRNGRAKFADRFIYFTKGFLSLSSIVEMIDSGDTVGTGYSNLLKGGEIPKGLNMSVDYIALFINSYNTGATPVESLFTEDWLPASSSVDWQNAELEIIQDDKVIFQCHVIELVENRIHENANTANYSTVECISAGKNLKSEFILKSGSMLQYKIKFPTGVTITPGTGQYTGVKVLMQGDGSAYRS